MCVCVCAGDRLLDDLMLFGRVETDGEEKKQKFERRRVQDGGGERFIPLVR